MDSILEAFGFEVNERSRSALLNLISRIKIRDEQLGKLGPLVDRLNRFAVADATANLQRHRLKAAA